MQEKILDVFKKHFTIFLYLLECHCRKKYDFQIHDKICINISKLFRVEKQSIYSWICHSCKGYNHCYRIIALYSETHDKAKQNTVQA